MMQSSLLKGLILAGGLAAAPLAIGTGESVISINNAWCAEEEEGGTCCPEDDSLCFPNGCSNPICDRENYYWRGDGKPCSAPWD